jgi:DNA-binding response OmpR family regulator
MRLLIVEDHEELAMTLATGLRREGMAVDVAHDGESGVQRAVLDDYDVIVLDRDLPVVHGDLVCQRLVAAGCRARVLMLTAAGTIEDRVDGLTLGADDYLPKPFEPRELLARLRAILRRKAAPATADVRRFGRLEIDRAGRRVTIDGEECPLTSYQFALLDALAGNAGRVMSRDALMDLTKGETLEAFDRSVDVHISRIRAAIEDDVKKPRRIITVRGAGYVFAKEQDRGA